MPHWHVEITLEGNQYYAYDLPKTNPNQKATDIVEQIVHVPYPVFPDSETEYTVLNSKKIICMDISEVN